MKRSAVAVGTFDGLHCGHRYLLERLTRFARSEGLRAVVVTLCAPVRPVPGLLTTVEEKIRLISCLPVDEIMVLPTTPDIIDQPAAAFFDSFIVRKLGAKRLVVGRNFAFGYGREGNIEWLKRAGPSRDVRVTVVQPLRQKGDIISSSRIRALVQDGDIDAANRLLGRFYSVEGIPEKGRGVGTTIGFPTVNLPAPQDKLLPHGVFAALVERKGTLMPAVANIGTRPTFFSEGTIGIEIHLLSFNGVWGSDRTVLYLCHRLREEMRFSSVKGLQRQIALDREAANVYFGGAVRTGKIVAVKRGV